MRTQFWQVVHTYFPAVHMHQWSSGRIHRCHRCDPGSIPGWCNIAKLPSKLFFECTSNPWATQKTMVQELQAKRICFVPRAKAYMQTIVHMWALRWTKVWMVKEGLARIWTAIAKFIIQNAQHDRQRGDLSPCGQSPMDFESITLTTRSHCHVLLIACLHSLRSITKCMHSFTHMQ